MRIEEMKREDFPQITKTEWDNISSLADLGFEYIPEIGGTRRLYFVTRGYNYVDIWLVCDIPVDDQPSEFDLVWGFAFLPDFIKEDVKNPYTQSLMPNLLRFGYKFKWCLEYCVGTVKTLTWMVLDWGKE